MTKYQNGKIYQITDCNYTLCYIGSTTQSLSQRMACHRSYYKSRTKQYSCFSLFDAFGIDNCKIELMEAYPCNSKEELVKRKGEVIRQTNCVNKTIPNRTRKQWRLDHKEHLQECAKKRYETHCEEDKARAQAWREDNREKLQQDIFCPCGGRYKYEHSNHHSKTKIHIQYLANLESEFNTRN